MSLKKKLKSLMFKGKIRETVGEAQGISHMTVKSKIKVHSIDSKEYGEKSCIGLEYIQFAFLNWQMMPITLTRNEAKHLQSLIEKALQ